ncbi:putative MFS allantoate transporter [Hyaloscypha bicolor E]|uniref:Putative MFS allantoate transporter n=1 Tax=Hyaloscypha bicolor E TaxID=1095630 RepID=A0A2J6TH20_9HELO|nr:putative MFS allantoate transporter [Hyaloscypha bicolor E]PMD62332.1 putative MFS allantoate transporter [Hyaloscypha bicolor E]
MAKSTRSASPAINPSPTSPGDVELAPHHKWKISATGGGDTAMALFNSPTDVREAINPDEERKLVRKIDWMILPYLSVCYAFFYIDKTTLSYAAIFNIRQDLNLVGTEYSWLSSIFYFGFLAWAFPINFLLQRFPIGKYLGVNIFMWGFFLMLQACARNFAELAALRALSGAAEACADPAFMLITSMWYTRRQQPIKIGLWYTANGVGVALGALCCIWGVVMFFLVPDSPVTAKRLTLHEKRIAVERLRENQTGVENKTLKPYQIKEAFLDYKLYMFFLIALMQSIVNGGISNFGTIIIKGFGFSTLVTTLMQIPYGVLIAISILVCVFLNDRLPPNNRCVMIIIFLLPNIAGAFGLRFVPFDQRVGRLICYYLTGPINASFVLLSLQTANIAGHTKKVVTNAMLFLGYCSPTYSLGIWSMIFAHLLEVAIVFVLRFLLKRNNGKRDAMQGIDRSQTDREILEEYERDLDSSAFGDLTDRENLNFRYIY